MFDILVEAWHSHLGNSTHAKIETNHLMELKLHVERIKRYDPKGVIAKHFIMLMYD